MYKVRLRILLAGVAAALLVLSWRVAQLQIVHGQRYRQAARGMLDSAARRETVRGDITDRNGQCLATSYPRYALYLDYRLLTAEPKWVQRQRQAIERAEGVDEELAKEIYRRREANTWRIAQRLADEQGVDLARSVQKIIRRVRRIRRSVGTTVREEMGTHAVVTDLPAPIYIDADSTIGAEVKPFLKRGYPYGDAACHIIGMVGQVTADELERMPDVKGGDEVGKRGIEKMCEELLRGRRGRLWTERVSDGQNVLEDVPAVPGRDIHLTIDIALQQDIEKLFREMTTLPGETESRNGAAVVISVRTGEVLAMVSIPTYDLETFGDRFGGLARDQLQLPLLHRAVTACYPPGSAAKPIIALAGLTERVIDQDTIYTCRGYLHNPNAFRCWIYSHGGSHGPLNVQGAIKNSCNVFFYHVGEQLGLDRELYWFDQFGCGQLPGTGLPEEKPGSVAAGELPPGAGTSRLLAIGQGPFSATPLQCANVMATIARGGVFLSPIIALEGGPSQVRRDLDIPPEHVAVVHRGMYEVCNSPGGTAYTPFHTGLPLGVEVCGKTGTAETAPQRVDSNENGRIDSEDEIVRRGDMAWFGGFAPYDDPQVAIAVVVEYVTGGGGSRYAAPIGREIIRLCRRYGYIR